MDAYEAIDRVRVVRAFSDEPIPDAIVTRIVNAGRRAGSSKNLQRWAFIVVTDRATLEALSKAGPWAGHLAGAAVAIALVTPDPHQPGGPLSVIFDLGRAAQNMVLAAWEAGIGSAPATVYEHAFVKETLGIPDDMHCEYILSFGYPTDPEALTAPKMSGGRAPMSEVLHRERW